MEIKERLKVRVKSWEQLKKEFKEDSDGDLETPSIWFTQAMKPLCGKTGIIKKYKETNSLDYFDIIFDGEEERNLNTDNDDKSCFRFEFSSDVVEPYIPKTEVKIKKPNMKFFNTSKSQWF